jgi:hypothetical protein
MARVYSLCVLVYVWQDAYRVVPVLLHMEQCGSVDAYS